MAIDNVTRIIPFLKFESSDDFYYLQILQRKKENSELGSNSRVIKNYYITSVEHFERRYEEIKQLCEIFNARASIRLNKRSFIKVGMKTMVNLANTMYNGEHKFLRSSYDRACGLGHNDKEKKWILDIDGVETIPENLPNFLYDIEPIGPKVLATIQSKTGYHLITMPFNTEVFRKEYPEIEIHKDNPTNLYIPCQEH